MPTARARCPIWPLRRPRRSKTRPADRTTSPRSSTPRAPRAAPRARCSATTTSPQCADPGRVLAIHARRRAHPRAAGVPYARPVRRDEHDPHGRRVDDLPAEVRPGAGHARSLPRATSLMGVPTFYTRLLADPGLDAGGGGGMRLFVSGSAPLLAETHREFQARTGHAILERYGMTETNMNTSNPYDGERVPGTVGFPLPGVELRVVDPETGRELAAGRGRHDRGEGAQRLQGLLAHAGEDRRRVQAGRLLHHRRPRQDRRARLCPHRRARQGPHHFRRIQHLSQGSGRRDRRDCPASRKAR